MSTPNDPPTTGPPLAKDYTSQLHLGSHCGGWRLQPSRRNYPPGSLRRKTNSQTRGSRLAPDDLVLRPSRRLEAR
ncbi:unnamed protein product [Sphagnum troendelagicum]